MAQTWMRWGSGVGDSVRQQESTSRGYIGVKNDPQLLKEQAGADAR